MDQYQKKIALLQNELQTRDEELKLAATYGTQLLKDKESLRIQIETLKQENHSLQLKFESKVKAAETQMMEIEYQKDLLNENDNEISYLKKEHQNINKKLQEKVTETEELQKIVNELSTSNDVCKEKISALQNELKTYEEQVQVSLNETNSEEFHKMALELQNYREEKMKMLSVVSDKDLQINRLKCQEEKYINLIESLRQGLEERDHEIQSYSVLIEQAREENTELLGQIELLKLEQIDTNRKGNSVFSEVEDRRKAVEKELIILKKKFDNLQENYNIRTAELRKIKSQMSIFLGMFSQKADYSYMEELEKSLHAAKNEIEYLNKKLAEQIQVSVAEANPLPEQPTDDQYGYLRALLQQSQKKVEELRKELQNQRMLKLAESNELVHTKQLLYRSQKNLESLKGEVLQLKLKLQDLTMKPGDEKQEQVCKTEIIPGFRPLNEQKNESLNKSKNTSISERKSVKKVLKKKENVPKYNLFEALKNPLVLKNDESMIASDSNSSNVTFDCDNKKLSAPVLNMKDGKSECTQQ